MDMEHEANSGAPPSSLPPRMDEVPTKQQVLALSLRASGATVLDVATELGVKTWTAARLLRDGMQSLHVRSQAELIAALGGSTDPVSLPPGLTRAEREVAGLVLGGCSNRDIALQRGTSTRTVANQLQAIYDKLGLGSRRELVAVLLGSPPQEP